MAPIDPFAFTRGNRKGTVLVVGEAWGENEAHQKRPFVGASGAELEKILREARIDPADCLFTNVVDARPARNNMADFLIPTAVANKEKREKTKGLYPSKLITDGVDKLHRLILELRPRIIIAVGNWPLWALTNATKVKDEKGFKHPVGIDAQRGSMLTATVGGLRIPLLPTYHPTAILRVWKWRHIMVRDITRASAYLAGALRWEDTRDFRWLIQPNVREVRAWVDRFLAQPGEKLILTLDLETFAGQIHIFGTRNPADSTCMCVPFMHVSGLSKSGDAYQLRPTYGLQEFSAIYRHLRRLLTDPRVYLRGQNLIYDIQYLSYYFAYTPKVADDTMIMQHVLSPGERKGLDFLASVYCTYYSYWKDDRKVSLANESTEEGCRYNCLDLEYTDEVAAILRPMVARYKEPQYQKRLELLHHLFEMMQRGVRIRQDLRRMQAKYLEHMIEDVEHWLDSSIPDYLKPERQKTSTGKWKTAAWYNSDKQLKDIIYGKLGIKPVWDADTGNPTLAKGALGALAKRVPSLSPFFNMLALLRSLQTYKQNFYDARVDPDGRMRCAYNPAATVTFRLGSSENVFGGGHNLQNVPRHRNPLNFFNVIQNLA